jgi:hypothetical protein
MAPSPAVRRVRPRRVVVREAVPGDVAAREPQRRVQPQPRRLRLPAGKGARWAVTAPATAVMDGSLWPQQPQPQPQPQQQLGRCDARHPISPSHLISPSHPIPSHLAECAVRVRVGALERQPRRRRPWQRARGHPLAALAAGTRVTWRGEVKG